MAYPDVSKQYREDSSALERLRTGVARLNAQLHFTYVNPAFIEMTGLSRWKDCPLEVLGPAALAIGELISRARSSGSVLSARGFDLTTRDSPQRVDITVSIDDEEHALLEVHPTGQHESVRAAPRISQSLRGLAHEVKNPLAGLRGAAQLLQRRATEPDQQHLAELIIAEADRLVALTDRLLRPGGKPHLSAVNLHELAERAFALVGTEVATHLEIDRDYDPSLPPFRGDADRLLQLLLNLLRNALQASATRIGMRTRAERGALLNDQPVRLAVRLDVIDNGDGVPEALRESLFLPLVSGRADGTGLGLALAQEIAQEHRGQLTFTSRPGRTMFSLTLPLERAHA
jgi:two-component system nitrogen regulation sensor histidine kinase GlnL